MSVLFYCPDDGERYEKLKGEIERTVPVEEIETYRTKEELCQRLCKPRYTLAVGILCAPNQRAFSDIFSLRDLLDGLRIILILPDRKQDTISKAHKLRPRFLSYVDDGPTFVIAVLNKMLSNSHPGEYQE